MKYVAYPCNSNILLHGREKKYEKFDFEDLVIEGEVSSPSELSIFPRYEKKFKNILPYRKNFNLEIKRSIERIR